MYRMNESLRSVATIVAVAALAFLGGLGCDIKGTSGEEGNFEFRDPTPGGTLDFFDDEQALTRPMAVGGRLDMHVADGGVTFRPSEVKTDAPEVIDIVAINDKGVTLEAKGPGSARVSVRRGEVWDHITVSAAPVMETHLVLYPLGRLYDASVFGSEPSVTLTPEAGIDAFLMQLGPSAQPLTGYGASDCVPDPPDARATFEEGSDRFWLVAPAAEGTLTLECGPTNHSIEIVGTAAATRLEGFDYLGGEWGPVFETEPTATHYVVLVAYDVDGRVVHGAQDAPVEFSVAEGKEPFVSEANAGDDPEIQDLLQRYRVLALQLNGIQEDLVVKASWAGITTDLTFRPVR